MINFRLTDPNPFTVFVGGNGVGKSNIFEALEFLNYLISIKNQKIEELFGGYKNFVNLNGYKKYLKIAIQSEHNYIGFYREPYESDSPNKVAGVGSTIPIKESWDKTHPRIIEYEQIAENFSRIFINNNDIQKIKSFTDSTLTLDASNLEAV